MKRFVPNHVIAVAGPDDERSRELVPLLRDRAAIDDRPTAYVCERFVCRLTVTESDALAAQLTDGRERART